MSLQYLKEDQLYERIPANVIENEDQKGLIQAVIGGFQDRLEDMRSYARRYELFFDMRSQGSLNQAVFVTFTTPTSMVVTRALDITDATPMADVAPDESQALITWAANAIGVDPSAVTSASRGEDISRGINIDILQYVAASIGAVLYNTNGAANSRTILQAYFPRLKLKGTAQSFDVMGRLLGYDDVRMVPLWTRASVRLPSDIGNSVNEPDMAPAPDNVPYQDIGLSYDPTALRDGPYYEFLVTDLVTNLPGSVNGLQPWVSVSTYGSPVLVPGTFTLANGDPLTKAYVWLDSTGNEIDKPTNLTNFTGFSVTALGQGEAFNGLKFTLGSSPLGITFRILDKLSSIKFRSFYYDLLLTTSMDKAVSLFGTVPATGALKGGKASVTDYSWDYLVKADPGTLTTPRTVASQTDVKLDLSAMATSVSGAVQTMDEVRAATRSVRKSGFGIMDKDQAAYAPYVSTLVLPAIHGSGGDRTHYPGTEQGITWSAGTQGYLDLFPVGDWTAVVTANDGTLTTVMDAETIDDSGYLINLTGSLGSAAIYGQLNTSTKGFVFQTSGTNNVNFEVRYILKNTNGINSEPDTNNSTYQARPEDSDIDDLGSVKNAATWSDSNIYFNDPNLSFGDDSVTISTKPPLEAQTADDYPWMHPNAGGDLVEVPWDTTDGNKSAVASSVAVLNQSGAPMAVYAKRSKYTPIPQILTAPFRDIYGQLAIGFAGQLISLPVAADLQNIYSKNGDNDVSPYLRNQQLFHVGLVNNLLVADPAGYLSPARRNNLVAWLPFNEHPEAAPGVLDNIDTLAGVSVAGMTFNNVVSNRVWDDCSGWGLSLYNGAALNRTTDYNVNNGLSFAFRLKLGEQIAGVTESYVALTHGDLEVLVFNAANKIAFRYHGFDDITSEMAAPAGYFWVWGIITPTGQVTLGCGSNVIYDTVGAIWPYSLTTSNSATFDGDLAISCPAGNRSFTMQNLMVWNTVKSAADISSITQRKPIPTVVAYWPSTVSDVVTGDKYGMRVLENGIVYFDTMPGAVRNSLLARTFNYTSNGEYSGEDYRRAVGLGSGTPTVAGNTPKAGAVNDGTPLGLVASDLTSSGTVVVTGTSARLNSNKTWDSVNGSNTYEYLDESSLALTTTAVPVDYVFYPFIDYPTWLQTGTLPGIVPSIGTNPNGRMVDASTNPIEQAVWLKSNGTTYEISISAPFGISVAQSNKADGYVILSKGGTYATVSNGTLATSVGTNPDSGSLYLYDSTFNLYELDIANGTVAANLVDVSAYNPEIPGGWLLQLDSNGSICSATHESKAHTENDVLTSANPLAGMLTPFTDLKREPVYVESSTESVYAEDSVPALPTFTAPTTAQSIQVVTSSCDMDWWYGVSQMWVLQGLPALISIPLVSQGTLVDGEVEDVRLDSNNGYLPIIASYQVAWVDMCTGKQVGTADSGLFADWDLLITDGALGDVGVDSVTRVQWSPLTVTLDYGTLVPPTIPAQWVLVSAEMGSPESREALLARHAKHNSGETVMAYIGTAKVRVYGGDYATKSIYYDLPISAGTNNYTISDFVPAAKFTALVDYSGTNTVELAQIGIGGVKYKCQGTFTSSDAVPAAYDGGVYDGFVSVAPGTYTVGGLGLASGQIASAQQQIVLASGDNGNIEFNFTDIATVYGSSLVLGYVANGTVAAPAGAGYTVNGGVLARPFWLEAGYAPTAGATDTFNNLPETLLRVDFAPVAGYVAPNPIIVNPTEAQTYYAIGTYTSTAPIPVANGTLTVGLYSYGTNRYYADASAPWFDIGSGTIPDGISAAGALEYAELTGLDSASGTVVGGYYGGSVLAVTLEYINGIYEGNGLGVIIDTGGTQITDATLVSLHVPLQAALTCDHRVVQTATSGDTTVGFHVTTNYQPDSITVYSTDSLGNIIEPAGLSFLSQTGVAVGSGTSWNYTLKYASGTAMDWRGDHYYVAVASYSGYATKTGVVSVTYTNPTLAIGYSGVNLDDNFTWDLNTFIDGLSSSSIASVAFYTGGSNVLAGSGILSGGSNIYSLGTVANVDDAFYSVIEALVDGNTYTLETNYAYCNSFYSAGTSAPGVPTGLTATPYDSDVTLMWNAILGVDGYKVGRSITSGTNYSVIASVGSNTYADVSASNGTEYFYVVDSYVGGLTSSNSNEASATPMPAPAIPTWQWGTTTGTNVNIWGGERPISTEIGWNLVSGATEYIIYKDGTVATVVASPVTQFTDLDVVLGVVNRYNVQAYNAYGVSAQSDAELWINID